MRVPKFLMTLAVLAGLASWGGLARAAELRMLSHSLSPFTFGPGGASGPTGLAVDITRVLSQRTGDTGTPTLVPFSRLLQEVQAGPMTMGFIVARTPAREKLFQWVGPLATAGVYLYKKAGAPFRLETLEDARALAHIGVQRGNADEKFLLEQGFKNLEASENQALDLKKLLLGRIDATPVGEIVFATAVKDAGLKLSDFERTPVKFYDSIVSIAFSPDVPKATVESWQAALDAMKASGEHAAILARYMGE